MPYNKAFQLRPGLWLKQYIDTCRQCHGTGSHFPVPAPASDEEQTCEPITCTLCEGSGQVYVTKEISIKVQPHKKLTA